MPPLPRASIDRIVALMEAEGMTAKVSSIHVNGWFGRYDKLGMTRQLLPEQFGIDLDARRDEFVFAGDSPNDAPLFAYFPLSVGVANIRPFLDRIATPPAFVTQAEAGAGFEELATLLLERLSARGPAPPTARVAQRDPRRRASARRWPQRTGA